MIFLPAHRASFTHDLVSGIQSFNFGGSQDAMFLQICNEKECWTHKLGVGPIDIESSESPGPIVIHSLKIVNKSPVLFNIPVTYFNFCRERSVVS